MVENKKLNVNTGYLVKEIIVKNIYDIRNNETKFLVAIRELVQNSYDAGAKNVHVIVDFKNKIMKVIDDGEGLYNNKKFEIYTSIAFSDKRGKSFKNPKNGRYYIGEKGIGKFVWGLIGDNAYVHSKNYKIYWDLNKIESLDIEYESSLDYFDGFKIEIPIRDELVDGFSIPSLTYEIEKLLTLLVSMSKINIKITIIDGEGYTVNSNVSQRFNLIKRYENNDYVVEFYSVRNANDMDRVFLYVNGMYVDSDYTDLIPFKGKVVNIISPYIKLNSGRTSISEVNLYFLYKLFKETNFLDYREDFIGLLNKYIRFERYLYTDEHINFDELANNLIGYVYDLTNEVPVKTNLAKAIKLAYDNNMNIVPVTVYDLNSVMSIKFYEDYILPVLTSFSSDFVVELVKKIIGDTSVIISVKDVSKVNFVRDAKIDKESEDKITEVTNILSEIVSPVFNINKLVSSKSSNKVIEEISSKIDRINGGYNHSYSGSGSDNNSHKIYLLDAEAYNVDKIYYIKVNDNTSIPISFVISNDESLDGFVRGNIIHINLNSDSLKKMLTINKIKKDEYATSYAVIIWFLETFAHELTHLIGYLYHDDNFVMAYNYIFSNIIYSLGMIMADKNGAEKLFKLYDFIYKAVSYSS